MKAKFGKQKKSARRYDNKETVQTWKVLVAYKGDLITPVRAEALMGRSSNASVVYANIWINGKDSFSTSGTGSAGGYGYHKTSAAISEALGNAGVTLWGSPYTNYGEDENLKKQCWINGCGDTSILQALEAVTRALGYRGKIKIV